MEKDGETTQPTLDTVMSNSNNTEDSASAKENEVQTEPQEKQTETEPVNGNVEDVVMSDAADVKEEEKDTKMERFCSAAPCQVANRTQCTRDVYMIVRQGGARI